MKKQVLVALTALAVSLPTVTLVAQGTQPNKRVIAAMGIRFVAPKCSVKGGHFMVTSASTYYSGSFDIKDAPRAASSLAKTVELSKQAIVEYKQDQNGAAWYWMGRAYLQQGDVAGADTALTRASALLPDCAEEIKGIRRLAWQPLIQAAADMLVANKPENADSVLILLREANHLSQDSPKGYYYMGIAQQAHPDSAIFYFKMALEKAGTSATFKAERDATSKSLMGLYLNKGMDNEAKTEARKILSANPKDDDAKRMLFDVLSRSKDAADQAEAKKIQADLLAAAEADGSISASDLARSGVDAFQLEEYAKAKGYFEKALAKEPWRRDILFNLINAHFALKDYTNMLVGLDRELAAEPYGEDFMKLKIKALSDAGQQDKLGAAANIWAALPVDVYAQPIMAGKESAKIDLEVTGREASDDKGKIIPARAVTLTFEFLDNKGAVVSSKDLAIPVVAVGTKQKLSVEGSGKGIVDFRYTEKKN